MAPLVINPQPGAVGDGGVGCGKEVGRNCDQLQILMSWVRLGPVPDALGLTIEDFQKDKGRVAGCNYRSRSPVTTIGHGNWL